MIKLLKPAMFIFALLTFITGIVYPLIITGVSQVLFPSQANGSLLSDTQGHVRGSNFIGQPFSEPTYFWGRPSATSPFPNNAAASSGSNLGPTNPALVDALKVRIEALKNADPDNQLPIPVDLVTASGSGLDPHISPAAANYQVHRIAKARHIHPDKIYRLIEANTQDRQFGFLGEARINVLSLNLALDALR